MLDYTVETKDKIDDMHKAIIGNGNPKLGFIHRIATLEATLIIHSWILGILTVGIVGGAIKLFL
jgi:hypothetical protein